MGKGLRRREILTPSLTALAALEVIGLGAGCGSSENPLARTKKQGTDTKSEWKRGTEEG